MDGWPHSASLIGAAMEGSGAAELQDWIGALKGGGDAGGHGKRGGDGAGRRGGGGQRRGSCLISPSAAVFESSGGG